MIKFLLYNGSDITLTDNYENTPLMQAIDKPEILKLFLNEKDTIRQGMLLNALKYKKKNKTTIITELITKEKWNSLYDVILTLKQLDQKIMATMLCEKNPYGLIPMYLIFKNAPENIIYNIIDNLEGIKNTDICNIFSNDTCLSYIENGSEKLIKRIKLIHHFLSKDYKEVTKICKDDIALRNKLYLMDLNDNKVKQYKNIISLFHKAGALEHIHIIINEKLTDEYYSELLSPQIKTQL
jgi:hypothetical protein